MRKNREKLQVAENKQKVPLAFPSSRGLQYQPMSIKQKKTGKPKPIQLRPTVDDYAIIQAGVKKHGVDQSQILRMALRRFAEAEGLVLKTA